MHRRLTAVVVALFVGVSAIAANRPPAFRPESFNLRTAGTLAASVVDLSVADVVLGAAERPQLGGEPARVGITRALPQPLRASEASGKGILRFRSTGATRVRLHLTDAQLSSDATLWVYGAAGEAIPFGRELLGPDGGIWTPSVGGDTIGLGFGAGDRFVVAEIAHDFAIEPKSIGCLTDVACNAFADRETLSKAVAQMRYQSTDGTYVCSGALIAGPQGDRLFLTAHHCISTQSEASSLELTWDYRSPTCGAATAPSNNRTQGATLLATSATSDVTLLRLSALPAGRWLMGWSTNRPAAGTKLYRISHPYDTSVGIFPQMVSMTTVTETANACNGFPRPTYLYSTRDLGGTAGGSSGSPVITEGGYIVGQLYGACGPAPVDGCGATTRAVDGWLGESYPVLQPFIDPQTTSCSSCVANAQTACLLGGRFKVTMTWIDDGAHLSGNGSVIKYADNLPEVSPQFGPLSESAFFSMYSFAPKSIETLVRILKGQNINNKYWVFVMGFTGAQYTVTVTDTQTCATWTRMIPAGATTVTKDFEAFPFP